MFQLDRFVNLAWCGRVQDAFPPVESVLVFDRPPYSHSWVFFSVQLHLPEMALKSVVSCTALSSSNLNQSVLCCLLRKFLLSSARLVPHQRRSWNVTSESVLWACGNAQQTEARRAKARLWKHALCFTNFLLKCWVYQCNKYKTLGDLLWSVSLFFFLLFSSFFALLLLFHSLFLSLSLFLSPSCFPHFIFCNMHVFASCLIWTLQTVSFKILI